VENKNTDNSRNGYSAKTIKSEFGEVEIQYQGTAKENLNLKLYPGIRGMFPELKKKLLLCMPEECLPGI